MTRRIILIFFLTFVTMVTMVAQTIPFKNYTVREGLPFDREGLPSNTIYDIKQDKEGYIWLATESGLVKFDGYNFKTFTVQDGLYSNFLLEVFVANDGTVWTGDYFGGVCMLFNDKIKITYSPDEESIGIISDIFQGKDNRIWYSTYEGLFYVKGDSIYSVFNNMQDENNRVLSQCVDSQGVIWFSTLNSVYCYDSVLKEVNWGGLDGSIVTDIIQDKNNAYWLATIESGIYCYKNNVLTNFSKGNGLQTNEILCLLETRAGDIFAGTNNYGIQVIRKNKKVENIRLKSNQYEIAELIQDDYGRIWARTFEEGIFLINKSEIMHLGKKNGLVSNSITCIFEDLNSNIWFGSSNGGLSVFNNPVFTLFKPGSSEESSFIRSVKATRRGEVLFGTDQYLYSIDNSQNISKYIIDVGELLDPSIISIDEDESGIIWLGTIGGLTKFENGNITYKSDTSFLIESYYIWSNSLAAKGSEVYSATENGLIKYDGNKYTVYGNQDGLISDNLFSINIDKEGNIWCGTSEGLSIFDGIEFHNFTMHDGLSNNFCNDIQFDSNGVAWIATDYGITAAVLDKDFNLSTRKYTHKNGLTSNVIYSILSDKKGNIWIGHNRGVDKLDPVTKTIKNYGLLEGFLPMENNSGAIDIDKNGNIWFGTVDGLVKYNPQNDIIINNQPPILHIKGVKLYNDTTDLKKYYTETDSITNLPVDLILPYNKNDLIFSYVGIHFKLVEKNLYKYKLLGYNKQWSKPVTEIVIPRYQKIDPGQYTFQVMAANSDGVWTKEPVEFSFEISPPWWETWWARSIQISLAIGIIILIINLRERKLKYDRDVLRQKVKERTAEIEKQKEKIEDQKREITDSIEYAQHIQSAILPKDDTIRPLLNNYFILYKPRDIVSGDFYWIDGTEERVIVIAADCTGHGVPGAFMSMLGVATLNQINAAGRNFSAGEILDNLRAQIIATLSHTLKDEEARDGMDLAMCIINFKSLEAQFAGALNPLILIRNNETIIYKADKMPVGLHVGEIRPFTTQCIDLKKNDCLYMFSDGYADQFGGPNGKKFMSRKFRELLSDISGESMEKQNEILDNTINEWMEGQKQIDDILVMGIRV